MDLGKFEHFPDTAQLWIYGFAKMLGVHEKRLIEERLNTFLKEWASHGDPVRGAYDIVYDRFVIITGACDSGISGCAIDSSVEPIKHLREAHGLDGLDRDLVFFRNDTGEIEAIGRTFFKESVACGLAGPETPVFDTTLQTLGDLRGGRFERRFADCWHARAFSSSK